MPDYWSQVEPYWNDCRTDDPGGYLAFYKSMPPIARDLLTTHWVVSEVCNGGFHQLFTNPTGVLIPEAVTGFRSMGLVALADIASEAASFFGHSYPREQTPRIEALERYAARSGNPDDWNPFDQLDDQFYLALGLEGEQDAYTSAANAYAKND
jgi:hypothetical protein